MSIVATGSEPLPLRAWGALRLLLWYFAIQGVVGGVLLVASGTVDASSGSAPPQPEDADVLLLVILVGTLVGAGVTWWRLRRNLRGGAWPSVIAALGWRPVPRAVVIRAALIGVLLAGFYVLIAIPYFFPPTSQDSSAIAELISQATPLGHFYLTVLAVLVAPLAEEFLFRGVVLAGLGTSWGYWPAITASTSLFALIHLDQIGSYWPAFIGIIIMALVAMALRLQTRSLWPCIAMHTAYNAVVMASTTLGN
jgi:membrane protease YdiL (CAAX protease family)